MNLFGGNPKLMLVIYSLFVLLASLPGLAVAILILQLETSGQGARHAGWVTMSSCCC